jgi:two-component system, NtrC family, response regulator AtoC
MSLVRQKAEKVASTNVPVLVEGAGGTGKELIARWIHARSPRCSGPFIKVNCAAIPGALLESELFGYEKGAFTGAYNRKPGRVEQADTGTLFLDEIGDLDLSLQSKLLHFLQDGRFTRIGDTSERSVDIRLICATNRNLAEEIKSGRFRADLFYRINVVQVRLPCLRERSEDLPVLAEYFRAIYMQQFERECEPLSPEVIGYLSSLSWPGNVREFSNGIARYVLIGPEATLAPESHRRRLPEGGTIPLKRLTKEAVREMERTVIMEALKANQWNRRKTAEALKISYRALIYKIRDAGLSQRQAPAASLTRVTAAAQPRRKHPLPRD